MPTLTILLDSNEYIFGLKELQASSTDLLATLTSFSVKLPRFILDELHDNLGSDELKKLYRLIRKTKTEIIEQKVPLKLVETYQKQLPTEDAVIAAYCEFLQVDVLISENRHFLMNFHPKTFDVFSALNFLIQYPNF